MLASRNQPTALQRQKIELETRVRELNDVIIKITEENNELKGQLRLEKSRVQMAYHTGATAEKELHLIQARIPQFEAEIDELKLKCNRMTDETILETRAHAQTQRERDLFRCKVQPLQDQIENLRSTLEVVQREKHEIAMRLEQLEAQSAHDSKSTEQFVASIHYEYDTLREKSDLSNRQYREYKESYDREIAGLQKNLTETQQRYTDLQNTFVDVQERYKGQKHEIVSLRDQIQRLTDIEERCKKAEQERDAIQASCTDLVNSAQKEIQAMHKSCAMMLEAKQQEMDKLQPQLSKPVIKTVMETVVRAAIQML